MADSCLEHLQEKQTAGMGHRRKNIFFWANKCISNINYPILDPDQQIVGVSYAELSGPDLHRGQRVHGPGP